MAQTYTPKELLPYKGLFYEGINKNERHGCDRLFEECSMNYGSGSVDDFIRHTYLCLSAKKNNLVMVSGQIPENSGYSRNLRNIETILKNIEKSHPRIVERA